MRRGYLIACLVVCLLLSAGSLFSAWSNWRFARSEGEFETWFRANRDSVSADRSHVAKRREEENIVTNLLTMVLFAVLSAGLWRELIWIRRRDQDRCEVCGYSHVGNVSGICPECGNSVPPTPVPGA